MSLRIFRILILAEVLGDTRRYRSLHLLEQLQLAGCDAEFRDITEPGILKITQNKWDVVILQRLTYGRIVKRIIDTTRSQGAFIISDFDDLIFDVKSFPYINSPDFANPIRRKLYQEMMVAIRQTLLQSDACLASTEFLADRIRDEGKPTWVHRNAFSPEMLEWSNKARLSRKNKNSKEIVIGYASGTPTHNRDFAMIKPALIEVMHRYPHVRLSLIGPLDIGDGWEGLSERISRQPLVPWRELPQLLANFDINLAPLVPDNPFSQSKSEIKWMEAGLVGVPTIATPTDAFSYAIKHGENGFLFNDHESFLIELTSLINNENLRQQTGNQARSDCLNLYNYEIRQAQLVSILEKIIKCSINPQKSNTLSDGIGQFGEGYSKYYEAPSLFFINRAYFMLRNQGFLTLLGNFMVYIHRIIRRI